MTEYITPEATPPLPIVEAEGHFAEQERLIHEDYEKHGWLLNSPDFQELVVKLDSADFDVSQEEALLQTKEYIADRQPLNVEYPLGKVKRNRFLKAAATHSFWKKLAAKEGDLNGTERGIALTLLEYGSCLSESQLAFNYRHNIEDAQNVLKGIKHLELEPADKAKIVEEAKDALVANGLGDEFQIKSKEQLKEDKDRLTSEKAAEAWHLGRLMAGELDENVPEATRNYLGTIKETISREIDFIKHQLEGQGFAVDARLLEDEEAQEVGMVPLEKTLSKLVARYIVQSAGNLDVFLANPDSVPLEETKQAIAKAMDEYLLMYRHDIPLYDEVFDNFDAMRLVEDGKVPFEVYLGRDGVYAFSGRKAQQQAEKWEIDDKGHRTRKQGETTVAIAPKYLVFPRYYMTGLAKDAQAAYLEQENVTKGQDPHFFDTGFKGTIPEHILKVLGYDESEIEKHIHLLSSDASGRELKHVRSIAATRGYNLRNRVVDIEHSSKATKTSEGLYRDDNGKIRPIEVASSPRDQLIFQFVKQGIWRHYWTKNLQYRATA